MSARNVAIGAGAVVGLATIYSVYGPSESAAAGKDIAGKGSQDQGGVKTDYFKNENIPSKLRTVDPIIKPKDLVPPAAVTSINAEKEKSSASSSSKTGAAAPSDAPVSAKASAPIIKSDDGATTKPSSAVKVDSSSPPTTSKPISSNPAAAKADNQQQPPVNAKAAPAAPADKPAKPELDPIIVTISPVTTKLSSSSGPSGSKVAGDTKGKDMKSKDSTEHKDSKDDIEKESA